MTRKDNPRSQQAQWTHQGIRATPGGGLVIPLSLPQKKGPPRRAELRLSPDESAVLQAQVDRLMKGGWEVAGGLLRDEWATTDQDQEERRRGAAQ